MAINYGIPVTSRNAQGVSVVPRLRAVANGDAELSKSIKELDKLSQAHFKNDLANLALEMKPIVVRELGDNYRKSGVGIKTGTLWETTVDGVTIEPFAAGFRVRMKAGVTYKGEPTANVYGSAGEKKYGSIRLPGAKRLTGKLRKVAIEGLTGQSAGLKGVVERDPYPDFFTISTVGPTAKAYERGLQVILQKYGIGVSGKYTQERKA